MFKSLLLLMLLLSPLSHAAKLHFYYGKTTSGQCELVFVHDGAGLTAWIEETNYRGTLADRATEFTDMVSNTLTGFLKKPLNKAMPQGKLYGAYVDLGKLVTSKVQNYFARRGLDIKVDEGGVGGVHGTHIITLSIPCGHMDALRSELITVSKLTNLDSMPTDDISYESEHFWLYRGFKEKLLSSSYLPSSAPHYTGDISQDLKLASISRIISLADGFEVDPHFPKRATAERMANNLSSLGITGRTILATEGGKDYLSVNRADLVVEGLVIRHRYFDLVQSDANKLVESFGKADVVVMERGLCACYHNSISCAGIELSPQMQKTGLLTELCTKVAEYFQLNSEGSPQVPAIKLDLFLDKVMTMLECSNPHALAFLDGHNFCPQESFHTVKTRFEVLYPGFLMELVRNELGITQGLLIYQEK